MPAILSWRSFGKSLAEAQALLSKQPGVSKATLTFAQGTTLPTDPRQITITTMTTRRS